MYAKSGDDVSRVILKRLENGRLLIALCGSIQIWLCYRRYFWQPIFVCKAAAKRFLKTRRIFLMCLFSGSSKCKVLPKCAHINGK